VDLGYRLEDGNWVPEAVDMPNREQYRFVAPDTVVDSLVVRACPRGPAAVCGTSYKAVKVVRRAIDAAMPLYGDEADQGVCLSRGTNHDLLAMRDYYPYMICSERWAKFPQVSFDNVTASNMAVRALVPQDSTFDVIFVLDSMGGDTVATVAVSGEDSTRLFQVPTLFSPSGVRDLYVFLDDASEPFPGSPVGLEWFWFTVEPLGATRPIRARVSSAALLQVSGKRITVRLSRHERMSVQLVSPSGKLIRTLHDGVGVPGAHVYDLGGIEGAHPDGCYILMVETDKQRAAVPVTLLEL
jgi:hypothetical protein